MDQISICGSHSETTKGLKCPICKNIGQNVAYVTVKSLVKASEVENDDYSICLNPQCEVVYFSHVNIFNKEDVKVKVWFKESNSPIPICYCNNVSDQDIYEHIVIKQCCSNLADIKNHTGANNGKHCLTMNPTGK